MKGALDPGEGCTLLFSLYKDVPLERVWFLASLPWAGYIMLRESVLNRVWICPKQGRAAWLPSLSMICPEQGRKIEGVNQGGYFKYLVPNQEQVFILSAGPLYPNIGQVPSLTGALDCEHSHFSSYFKNSRVNRKHLTSLSKSSSWPWESVFCFSNSWYFTLVFSSSLCRFCKQVCVEIM